MKKLMSLAMIALFAVAFSTSAYAVDPVVVTTTADVSGDIEFTVQLFEEDIDGTEVSVASGMDFGELDGTTGTLRSNPDVGVGAYLAYFVINTHQVDWTLKQTGTAMESGENALPTGSLVVNPIYLTDDNGGVESDGTIGTAATWVAADKEIATGTKGSVIRAYYSITDDSSAGATAPAIPLDQPAGTYTGTVTFTLTTA